MGGLLLKLLKGEMFKDSSVLFAGMAGAHLFNLLFQMAMGRTLDADEFALLVMFLGVFNVISLPLGVVSISISRYVSLLVGMGREGDVLRLIIAWTVRLGICGTILTLICFMVPHQLASLVGMGRAAPIYIFGLSLLGVFLRPIVLGALLGIQRFGCWCFCNILGALVRLLIGAYLVWSISPYAGWGLLGNGLGPYAIIGVGFVLLWFFLRGQHRTAVALPSMHGHVLISFVIMLGYSFLMTGDVILVKQRFSECAGDFAYAATLARLVLLVPQALVGAMFPKVVGEGQGTRRQIELFWKTMGATFVCSAVAALVFSLSAGWLAEIIFGIADPSNNMIRWCALLSWTMVPVAMLNVPTRYAMAKHRMGVAIFVPVAALCYIVVSYTFAHNPDLLLYALGGISSMTVVIFGFSVGMQGAASATDSGDVEK